MILSHVASVLLVVAVCMIQDTTASGALNFWDGPNFTGVKLKIHGSVMGQTCYNANVEHPSSITWENLPTTGFFDGKAKIAFYEDENCVGTWRAWFSTEKDFPTNVKSDGLNSIQSFMLWQLNKEPRVYKQLG
ncbi:hypothetical protein P3T76_012975 [Phytophthora citrophthora]|uniref:Uncharacterized protein n=1 Tax=Phytophthora citrophthora TaxID=4793 RepID=A0AAD9G4J3_9STRA|nr:hypothetical protein P3T76_012975 [Phytophthora citrophthora]